MTPCMGGWCKERDYCARYDNNLKATPVERFCKGKPVPVIGRKFTRSELLRDAQMHAEMLLGGQIEGWLNDMTTLEEETGCMLWEGARGGAHKSPMMQLPTALPANPLRKRRTVSVRRVMWEETHKKAVPNGWTTYARCGNILCVNPAHIGCMPIPEVMKINGAKAKDAMTIVTRIKLAAIARARSPLTDEDVFAIRQTMEGVEHGRVKLYQELADKYGVSATTIQNIALGVQRVSIYDAGHDRQLMRAA